MLLFKHVWGLSSQGVPGKLPLGVGMNQRLLPLQSSQANKTSYGEILSSSVGSRGSCFLPSAQISGPCDFFRDPWRQVRLGVAGVSICRCFYGKDRAALTFLSNEPGPRLSGTWELHSTRRQPGWEACWRGPSMVGGFSHRASLGQRADD